MERNQSRFVRQIQLVLSTIYSLLTTHYSLLFN